MSLWDLFLQIMEVPCHSTSWDSMLAWIIRISPRHWSGQMRYKSSTIPDHQTTSWLTGGNSYRNFIISQSSPSLERVLLWLLISILRRCSNTVEQLQLVEPMGGYKPSQTAPRLWQIFSELTGNPYPSSGEVLTTSANIPSIARQGWAMIKTLSSY